MQWGWCILWGHHCNNLYPIPSHQRLKWVIGIPCRGNKPVQHNSYHFLFRISVMSTHRANHRPISQSWMVSKWQHKHSAYTLTQIRYVTLRCSSADILSAIVRMHELSGYVYLPIVMYMHLSLQKTCRAVIHFNIFSSDCILVVFLFFFDIICSCKIFYLFIFLWAVIAS